MKTKPFERSIVLRDDGACCSLQGVLLDDGGFSWLWGLLLAAGRSAVFVSFFCVGELLVYSRASEHQPGGPRPDGLGGDASVEVRGGLGSMPGSAGKQGYIWSPELSSNGDIIPWLIFSVWHI